MALRERTRGTTPRDEAELVARARDLEGVSLAAIARTLGEEDARIGLRTKGRAGDLVERALGATGGSGARVDFPDLGVELKTVPVDAAGRPRESTFVCTFPLSIADRTTWAGSWARRKLACVLWVPVIVGEEALGRAVVWRPTPAQEAVLAADFEEIVGLAGAGRVEDLRAHVGRWLQVRPKAANNRERTLAFGPESEPVPALPRGFYLRARFTGAILRDPAALPE